MAYHPSISDEEGDSVGNANQEKVNFKAEEMNYYGKKYAKRVDSNEVYDYDTFVAAMSNPQIKPRLIGHWIKTDGKRGKLVKVVF